MMKIGILTHPLGYNYGGLLQNFALQQVLIRHGFEPITINHINPPTTMWIKILIFVKRFIGLFLGNEKPLFGFPSEDEKIKLYQFIDEFKERCIKKTSPVLISKLSTLPELKSLKAIVVGSDQVWRYTMINTGFEEMFLQSFEDVNIRKISYAASFGCDDWEVPNGLLTKIQKLASQFDSISVREKSGVQLCQKYLKRNAVVVLDPTLLLTSDDYNQVIDSSSLRIPSRPHSLMVYFLDRTQGKRSLSENVSVQFNLKENELLPKSKFSDVGSKHIDECVFCSVEEWLGGIRDADMVLTDSFHGMAFSIIYNKPFWVIGNKKRGMARFETLLDALELQDRLISMEDVDRVDFSAIVDWERVNDKLNSLRSFSNKFLSDSLKKIS